ncbi:F0F1 ATP synthase subunit alpha [Cryptosporidium felis]|nr:F0F1 ATP synthase subunit alpha [Cryptosporidium felis]
MPVTSYSKNAAKLINRSIILNYNFRYFGILLNKLAPVFSLNSKSILVTKFKPILNYRKPNNYCNSFPNFRSSFTDFISRNNSALTSGNVISVSDGIAQVDGIKSVKFGELVEFSSGEKGIAFNLENNNVGVLILGEDRNIRKGDPVFSTNSIVNCPVGKELLGRVVDALGNPIDGNESLSSIANLERREIDVKAPGIIDRKSINEQLITGIKFIDSLIPIGLGQREAIIGDRSTGKTSLALDIILNQRKFYDNINTRKYCIYVAIGQKRSSVAQIVKLLEKYDALKYTIVVAATASNAASLQFLAPFTGCTMGEWFRDNGQHCIIVYDDLSKQANAYRQINLLLKRPIGRESYPGDTFYIHSRLLERSSKLSDEKGGGSLTALPIVETQSNNYSSYIPNNITSITDGHIILDSDLMFKGIRPAFNLGLSISRIGSSTQLKYLRKVSQNLKLSLLQSKESQQYSNSINNKYGLFQELFKQQQFQFTEPEFLTCIIYLIENGFLNHIDTQNLRFFENSFRDFLIEKEYYSDIIDGIKISSELNDVIKSKLIKALNDYNNLL